MLALARYFAKRERRRDLYFVMATGHFQLPQFIRKISDRFVIGNDAISRWMYDQPEIYPNALAGVTMEHLGCTMWADNADGEYVATGGYEWGSTYTTPRQGSVSVINYNLQQVYPTYLLQAGSRTQPSLLNLDKLDKKLTYGQILSFARTIRALDAAPATDF